MVEPVARIRPYELRDRKLVRFMLGKGGMEPLTVANRQVYFNPLVMAVWIGLSCISVEALGWWPNVEDYGLLGYFQPFPVFACVAVVFMVICDWINRPSFEDPTNAMLRRPDLVDIEVYYARSPSSGFWLLEYGEKFVGLIAIDASLDAESEEVIGPTSPPQPKNVKTGKLELPKGTSPSATIRHFYVEEPYRVAGIQNDLLEHAITHAFNSDSTVQNIIAVDSPQNSYIGKALRNNGFQLDKKLGTYGVLRWQNSARILKRKSWQSSHT
ncbi:hypothetical protein BKA93DRAFT_737280 [Sparassis latifolia]|uniref:N-acetyltransferase domain-containing protein n=1 Tax=Sparassis crispa TaxID=139825 RepID=A0A401G808_9APHY|nr:hypothetical protein SCP_0111610 [Sparassis crispa]GBE78278.1 hypothetical protein SCP_0111610 [Sparassis crispa]